MDIRDGLKDVRAESDYTMKARLLQLWLMLTNRGKKKMPAEEAQAIAAFVFPEMEQLIRDIPRAAVYREKDTMAEYGDKLMALLLRLINNGEEIGQSDMGVANTLAHMIDELNWLEHAVDALFRTETVSESAMTQLIEKVSALTDETHRGVFWMGLMHNELSLGKLRDGARTAVTAFICAEMTRYLEAEALDEAAEANLENLADVCGYFIDDEVAALLTRVLSIEKSNLRFYAVNTLLTDHREVRSEIIAALAADPVYAALTHAMLENRQRLDLFPAEYADGIYLAKSNLLHWLMYPTELGKLPDEIEFFGKTKVKGRICYLFIFRSDSDTLADDSKNEWLVGWSSDGRAFSRFDKLSEFAADTPEKTLRKIKKTIR